MAKKSWEQLTQAEKIEDLRRDVVKLFEHATELLAAQRKTASEQRATANFVSEVAKAVEALEEASPRKKPKAK